MYCRRKSPPIRVEGWRYLCTWDCGTQAQVQDPGGLPAGYAGENAVKKRVTVDDFDVLMLRSDPSIDTGSRAWVQIAGITFCRVAKRRGVIVVNDPDGLLKAMNKMYF
jgi:glutathione synthase